MRIRTQIDQFKAIAKINALNLDKEWILDLKVYRKNRSNAQNKLLWMWLDVWGKELGYTKDEMYDVAVSQCWTIHDEELTCNNIIISRQRRTSSLNTKQFAEFLNNVDIKASETGTVLPHPEDLYYEAMLK